MKSITLKLGTMRKAQDWTIYPQGDDKSRVKIQCDTYIALIDTETGDGLLAGPHAGGAYFHHLPLGKRIKVGKDVIDAIKEKQPQKGDRIGPGVIVG